MGDHRASIKIEMEFHGVKDKCDMYINYYPEGCCNMDRRITEFINNIYEKGMDAYEKQVIEYEFERWKKDIEDGERSEFERLKKKFQPTPGNP